MSHHVKQFGEVPRRKRPVEEDDQIVEPRAPGTISAAETFLIQFGGDGETGRQIFFFKDYVVKKPPEIAAGPGTPCEDEFTMVTNSPPSPRAFSPAPRLKRTAASLWERSEPIVDGVVAVYQVAALLVRPTPLGVVSYLNDQAGDY